MNRENLSYIQEQIDYQFQNKDLLVQAFIRKSYAMENGGEDNELLEFIGDKVLDLLVVKYLTDSYGSFGHNDEEFNSEEEYDKFTCDYDEGKLTKMKVHLVQKKMLAHRIDLLRFARFLIMGKGEYNRHVDKLDSVKEDLFKAIIGAVALDSDWNMRILERVVDNMLCPDAELNNDYDCENFIGRVQDWTVKTAGFLPSYHIVPGSQARYLMGRRYIRDQQLSYYACGMMNRDKYVCFLTLPGREEIFVGKEESEYAARFHAAKLAYNFILDNDLMPTIRDEIEDPNYNDSIGQLETLSRKGYFSIPKYGFKETYTKGRNHVWACKCMIKEIDIVTNARSSSKKDAKKKAAFDMLEYVLQEE